MFKGVFFIEFEGMHRTKILRFERAPSITLPTWASYYKGWTITITVYDNCVSFSGRYMGRIRLVYVEDKEGLTLDHVEHCVRSVAHFISLVVIDRVCFN
jgi:hypothetical protein